MKTLVALGLVIVMVLGGLYLYLNRYDHNKRQDWLRKTGRNCNGPTMMDSLAAQLRYISKISRVVISRPSR